MNELISIIIPVYNVEKYIGKCIDSLIKQKYDNLEIILIDDGSSDNSGEICDKYAKKDKRIKVIHKKNSGQADSRNIGISKASGKYIGFVDSDDYIDKDYYNRLYKTLVKNNADVVTCKYQNVYNDDYRKEEIGNNIRETILDNQEALKELLLSQIDNYVWNKLYKREIWENIKFPIGKKMEDLGIMYLVIKEAKRIVITDYVGYYYRIRPNSTMTNLNLQLILNTREMVNKRYNDLQTNNNILDELNVNRLVFIKYYYEDLGKIGELKELRKFDDEYLFYRKYYNKYKKEVKNTTKSKLRKLDFDILYYSNIMLSKIYGIKSKIKKNKGE